MDYIYNTKIKKKKFYVVRIPSKANLEFFLIQ